MELTDHDRALMTADEIATLQGDDEERELLADVVAELEDEPAPDPSPEPDAAPETPESAPAPEAEEPEAADDTPFVPTYQADLPSDYETSMGDLKHQRDEVTARFKDGDLSADELLSELSRIDEKLADLRSARIKAEVSQEFKAQTAEQVWQVQVENFMGRAMEKDGVDYKANGVLFDALNAQVMRLGKDPANESKPGPWFLEQAHKAVMGVFGAARQKPSTPPSARTPDLKAVPKTLAGIPPAGGADDTGANEFGAIDSLDGMDAERAVAGMSKAQRDKWLRSA